MRNDYQDGRTANIAFAKMAGQHRILEGFCFLSAPAVCNLQKMIKFVNENGLGSQL